LPPQICDVPGAVWVMVDGRWAPATTFNLPAEQLAALPHATARFNLLAFFAILAVTTILIVGIKESANFNTGIVFVKLAAVLTFIAVALPFVLHHPTIAHDNWRVFLPPNTG
jgi:APA family basic amino acid/polyamine antiporter